MLCVPNLNGNVKREGYARLTVSGKKAGEWPESIDCAGHTPLFTETQGVREISLKTRCVKEGTTKVCRFLESLSTRSPS